MTVTRCIVFIILALVRFISNKIKRRDARKGWSVKFKGIKINHDKNGNYV